MVHDAAHGHARARRRRRGLGRRDASSTGSARTGAWRDVQRAVHGHRARAPHRPVPLDRRGRQRGAADGTLELSVDAEAPTRRPIAPPSPRAATGPVTVTLNTDEAGSGLDRTEYRVDGGPWRIYSAPAAEQVAVRRHVDVDRLGAGAGRLDGPAARGQLDGDRRRPRDALVLGPGRSATSRSSSSTRRSAPTAAGRTAACSSASRIRGSRSSSVRRRTATRSATRPYTGAHCSRQGSAATQLAWVAINCGHEIQVNDDPGGGEPQKTGSIYNFRPNNITQARPGPKGEWTNYEVRVEGQQYTIIREGEIINQFNNAIPRNSSRGGDAPTAGAAVRRGLHRPPEPRGERPRPLPQRARDRPLAGRAGRRASRSR